MSKYCSIVCDALKIYIYGTIVISLIVPYFLLWTVWRIISAILLLPAHIYQMGDDIVFQGYQRVILFLAETVTGSKVMFHGDVQAIRGKRERFILISNHQTSFDWVVVNMLAERLGMLGHVRYVIKNSIQALPILGFYFYQHGCIYVNRMQFNFMRMKTSLLYLQNKKIPSGVVIFPEGTRFDLNKENLLKESHSFADAHNLPRLDYVLIPRTKGFVLAMEYLRQNVDALYNVTILFDNTKHPDGTRTKAPSLSGFFTGCCKVLHIYVERIPITNVPSDEEECKKFLFDIFNKKNALVKSYYESREGPLPPQLSRGVEMPLNWLWQTVTVVISAVIFSFCVFTHQGLSLLFKTWLCGTIFGYSWLGMNAVA